MIAHSPNQQFYETAEVVERFSEGNLLFKAEEVILSSLRGEFKDKPLLEIGIGAGRVTPLLRDLSKDYIGADSSQRMIDLCKQKFGDGAFLACDARHMPIFQNKQFAAVFFCWNGIDEVSASDRMLILEEIYRVLKKDGVFVFSSHNLDWEAIPSYSFSGFSRSGAAFEVLRDGVLCLRAYASALSARLRSRVSRRGYAVIQEYEEPPGILVPRLFISKEAQVRQLLDAGFNQVEAWAGEGAPLDDENRGRDHLVYYVARKP